ncbi:hypothetical protein [uncultured Chryseobacterium sp.]|uniref:hypothetical protein n=1 Tax=uncultured Chryseobacterium sp. TaxID=259322 RepID=UPI0025CE8562|nr:hypothetical protein [uncultured Chryseobacterium sp.]
MKIFTEDLIILKNLYASKILNLYDIHKIYKLSPAQIVRCLKKFSEKKILEYDNTKVCITETGIKWVEANKGFIYLKRFEYIGSYEEDLYQGFQIEVNQLYKPKIYKIDSTLFKEGE